MATGGAWQSETFDNGRGIHHATQEPPPTASATPPAMYNPSPAGVRKPGDSAFGVITLSLRIAQIVFTVIALSVMVTNKATIYDNEFFPGDIKFSDIEAFMGVMSLTSIVCFYAIVQLVLCFVNMCTKGSFISSATRGFAMLTFLFDTVLAHALIAAAGAGQDSVVILDDFSVCDAVAKFCQKAQSSVAMSFFAFAVLAVSAVLYPVRLLRLTKG